MSEFDRNAAVPSDSSPGDFPSLVEAETRGIFESPTRGGEADTPVIFDGNSHEKFVAFRESDLVGLAISGGGIRSATFGLGFLQTLHRLKVLGLVDYLSTVSGGGYIGGFWSAWMSRHGKDSAIRFPEPERVSDADGGLLRPIEPPAIRHLREFSRFLSPRTHLLGVEMWHAVVAILSAVAPALTASLSLIGLVLLGWLGLEQLFLHPSLGVSCFSMLSVTVFILVAFEHWWLSGNPLEEKDKETSLWTYEKFAFCACFVFAMGFPLVDHFWSWLFACNALAKAGSATSLGPALAGTACEPAKLGWFFNPTLYRPSIAWLASGGVLIVLRAILLRGSPPSPDNRVDRPAMDRVIMRLLGPAIVWAAVATLWTIGANIERLQNLLGAMAVSGSGFALLRNWMAQSLRAGHTQGRIGSLKPYLPQILAYLTVGLAVASVAGAWLRLFPYGAVVVAGVALAMLLLVGGVLLLDPSEFGLHAFYRERLARAYLGASGSAPGQDGRSLSHPLVGDDLSIYELPKRPLHLICCAANDLSGDGMRTLMRASRSAVVSRHGVSCGNRTYQDPRLTLAGAITASAAAFNSNMGSVSVSLGAAVTFLMSAMNLRLGLWVPMHEITGCRTWLPGLRYYAEMFGLTNASEDPDEIHLSDGAHFENLALYELVRRHCRYIIVIDSGEDPNVVFDDFGNASRRIREDFGVDIDIDLEPLRPDKDRKSLQHMVVGTIHYADADQGILLYVKPTITGDEPPDVLQYRSRNGQFPHESTVDQFYDEAQWEAYRRLGEHTAMTALGFAEDWPGPALLPTGDWVFTTARQRWFPSPAGLADRVREMSEVFGAVEAELNRSGSALLREVFPEIESSPATGATKPGARQAKSKPADEEATRLANLLRITQIMEDVFSNCDLEAQWNHPLNIGWMNAFARWATTPTFRSWWPILSPMYLPGFSRFMEQRFAVLRRRSAVRVDVTKHNASEVPDGLARMWWNDRSAERFPLGAKGDTSREVYTCLMHIEAAEQLPARELQIGLVCLDPPMENSGCDVSWTSDNFFVPRSLWGTGLWGRFVEELLLTLGRAHIGCVVEVVVRVKLSDGRRDPAARRERDSYVEFYKAHQFRLEKPSQREEEEGTVRLRRKILVPKTETKPAPAPEEPKAPPAPEEPKAPVE